MNSSRDTTSSTGSHLATIERSDTIPPAGGMAAGFVPSAIRRRPRPAAPARACLASGGDRAAPCAIISRDQRHPRGLSEAQLRRVRVRESELGRDLGPPPARPPAQHLAGVRRGLDAGESLLQKADKMSWPPTIDSARRSSTCRSRRPPRVDSRLKLGPEQARSSSANASPPRARAAERPKKGFPMPLGAWVARRIARTGGSGDFFRGSRVVRLFGSRRSPGGVGRFPSGPLGWRIALLLTVALRSLASHVVKCPLRKPDRPCSPAFCRYSLLQRRTLDRPKRSRARSIRIGRTWK